MRSTFFAVAGAAVLSVTTMMLSAQERPKITGVSHLAVYTSDAAATDRYYRVILGAQKLPDPENPQGTKYALSATQFIEVLPLPANAGINRLDHAAFNTVNADGLRKYLAAKGWKTPASVTKGSDGSRWFTVQDPEGNKIEFIQPPANAKAPDAPNAIGHHIIHVGLLVHSREAQDKFYRDLLGFRPYWYGGMQDDKVDWVSQQVPDGHDWIEYMMTSGPSGSGIPANMTQQTLGVLVRDGPETGRDGHARLDQAEIRDSHALWNESGDDGNPGRVRRGDGQCADQGLPAQAGGQGGVLTP